MPDEKIQKIADDADMIVKGYAFKKIEQVIVKSIWDKDSKYMEA